jgi:hypothetical protein
MILFAIAINRIVNMLVPSVSALLYVYDVTIFYDSWSIDTIKHWLQIAINHVTLDSGAVFRNLFSPVAHPNLSKRHNGAPKNVASQDL